MELCRAAAVDALAVSQILQALTAAGKRRKPSDPDFARDHYIAHPQQICCTIAVDDDGHPMGFQSLKRATEGNPYGTPLGWGIIGTHIHPHYARRGVGRHLFSATRDAARYAELPAIEAFIGADNAEAIGYYEAMGFVTYRAVDGVDCKRFSLA